MFTERELMRTTLTCCVLCLLFNGGMQVAAAQHYPDRTVRLDCGIRCWRLRRHHRTRRRAEVVGTLGSAGYRRQPRGSRRRYRDAGRGKGCTGRLHPHDWLCNTVLCGAGLGSGAVPVSSAPNFTPIAKLVVAPIVLTVHPSATRTLIQRVHAVRPSPGPDRFVRIHGSGYTQRYRHDVNCPQRWIRHCSRTLQGR